MLIHVLIKDNLCKFWVKWPRGVSWWLWRAKMGFGITYGGFYIYYLNEWPYCDVPGISEGGLWSCASYEEPKFYREITDFVPAYLKQNCDENGIDVRFLHYYTAQDDYLKNNYTIITLLGGTKYYDNDYYQVYLGFLYNICNCVKGVSISYTCPNPCMKPGICSIEKNVIKGSCRKVLNKNIVPRLQEGTFRNLYGNLYQYESVCTCKINFVWNRETKKCDKVAANCNLERIGSRVCQNGGKCVAVDPSMRVYDFLVLRCICTPAWTGYLCTEPTDPCKRSRRLCGSFACKRDGTSLTKGYYCVCTKGFKRASEFEPQCVNINECNEEMPCQHGSICTDLVPDPMKINSPRYSCNCVGGFSGTNCEVPPRRPEWSEWSGWTTCSKTCGLGGVRQRTRVCSSGTGRAGGGNCPGLSAQTMSCVSDSLICQELGFTIRDTNEEDRVMDQHKMLRKLNVGWDEEEDKIIDDAFHWNERLVAESSVNTLGMLSTLEVAITITLITLASIICILLLFNIFYVGPKRWVILTWKSFIIRQGFGQKRRSKKMVKIQQDLQYTKEMKNAKKKALIDDKISKMRDNSISSQDTMEEQEDAEEVVIENIEDIPEENKDEKKIV